MAYCKVKQDPATSFHPFVCTYESADLITEVHRIFFQNQHSYSYNQYFVVSVLSRAPQLYHKP